MAHRWRTAATVAALLKDGKPLLRIYSIWVLWVNTEGTTDHGRLLEVSEALNQLVREDPEGAHRIRSSQTFVANPRGRGEKRRGEG